MLGGGVVDIGLRLVIPRRLVVIVIRLARRSGRSGHG